MHLNKNYEVERSSKSLQLLQGGSMQPKKPSILLLFTSILMLVSISCSTPAAEPTFTSTPKATATSTLTPTQTPTATLTPRPTRTPNLTATQRTEEYNAEVQKYFDLGYLETSNGIIYQFPDFTRDWAKIDYYQWWNLNKQASDFYLAAHFKWLSAIKNANESGCGFVFATQRNNDHYAVFLDRTNVVFLMADRSRGFFSQDVGKTRGTGRVNFGNPAEADFALIVKKAYAYVLVNNEVVGEYSLALSQALHGGLALSVLSGTNKDYGTSCEMTDIHLWIPKQ
jgi:hypothetical protein